MTVTEKWKDRKCDVALWLSLCATERENDKILLSAADHHFYWIWLLHGWLAGSNAIEYCSQIMQSWFVWIVLRKNGSIWRFQRCGVCAHIGCHADCAGRPTVTFFSLLRAFSGWRRWTALTCRSKIVPMDSFQLLLSCAQVIFNAYVIFHSPTTTTAEKLNGINCDGLLCHRHMRENRFALDSTHYALR